MDHDDVTWVPIIGARTTEQVDENVGACDVDLTDEQWDRILDARYRDSLWATDLRSGAPTPNVRSDVHTETSERNSGTPSTPGENRKSIPAPSPSSARVPASPSPGPSAVVT